MSNQRPGKTHKAALSDTDRVAVRDLVRFCEQAQSDLEKEGQEDSALRFELLAEFLRSDFKGRLEYRSRIIGL